MRPGEYRSVHQESTSSKRRAAMKARLTLGACAAVSLAILAGCGSSSSSSSGSSGGVSGTNLTVYSSLPLQGASRPNSLAVENGASLALAAVGGKVGKYTINYK